MVTITRSAAGVQPGDRAHDWVLRTALGELAGFAVPALTGGLLLWRFGEPGQVAPALGFALALVLAGMGEGAVLGAAQWGALRRRIPGVSLRAWAGATATAAGVAWTLGLTPSLLDTLWSQPPLVLVALWLVLAPPLLATIGVGQWLVLRRHVTGARRWIWANVLGWLLGLPVTFIGPALVPAGSPPAVWALAFLLSGLTMGAVVGLVTARALVRLTAPLPARS